MVHRGKEFGVDLYELERVAKVDFPTISADYGDAIGSCDRARGDLAQAMRRPEQFGGDALGPVYQAYLDLHDTVLGFVRKPGPTWTTRPRRWTRRRGTTRRPIRRPAMSSIAVTERPGTGWEAVSFDQLMEHARDITDKAVDLTAKEIAQKKATQSGANPDRNAIREPYAFIEAMFEPFSRLPIWRGTTR